MVSTTRDKEVFLLAPGEHSNHPSEIHPTAQGSILVVEDDPPTLRLERVLLEEEGYSVEVVGSGEEAIEAMSAKKPALVLLDIGLPGMDGFSACQRIREISRVPIIMVTGRDCLDDKVKGMNVGADDYVTKPFLTHELATRVKVLLRRSSVENGASPYLNGSIAQDQPADSTPQVPHNGVASTSDSKARNKVVSPEEATSLQEESQDQQPDHSSTDASAPPVPSEAALASEGLLDQSLEEPPIESPEPTIPQWTAPAIEEPGNQSPEEPPTEEPERATPQETASGLEEPQEQDLDSAPDEEPEEPTRGQTAPVSEKSQDQELDSPPAVESESDTLQQAAPVSAQPQDQGPASSPAVEPEPATPQETASISEEPQAEVPEPAQEEPLEQEPSPAQSATNEKGFYEGTVRLTVTTLGPVSHLINFVSELRQNSQFRLLRLVANQHKEGMDIWLGLREPLLLRSALGEMKGVSEVNVSSEAPTENEEPVFKVLLD